MALIECSECGKEISDRAESCPSCGLTRRENMLTPTRRSISVLLAMLGGSLGLHKFYLSRPGLGVLYLLFCWTFIPMILGFFEGLYYLSLSERDFQQRYGGNVPTILTGVKSSSGDKPVLSLMGDFFVWFLVFFAAYSVLIIALLKVSTETEHHSVWALPLAILVTLVLRFGVNRMSTKHK